MRARLVGLIALSVLTACGQEVQITSGQAYLARSPAWGAVEPMRGTALTPVDEAVREAAAIEPLLRFPARLGLARLQGGRLTPVPSEEADAWIALAERLGPGYGRFLPIDPLIVQFTPSAAPGEPRRSPIDTIRIGAARQHVDAVLIYEVVSRGQSSATPFSVLDLTIVGAFLVPSRTVAGEATAYATLVDVRNGYPYGNAMSQGRDRGIATTGGAASASLAAATTARVEAVGTLTTEVEQMMSRRRSELAMLPPPGAPRAVRAR